MTMLEFMNEPFFEGIVWGTQPLVLTPWKVIGVAGAMMFASRWIVQAYLSRKAGRSVTPPVFWIMSIIGSFMTLCYFFFSAKQDIVGITNTLPPCLVAVYNLILELRFQKREAEQKKMAEIAAANPAPVPTNGGTGGIVPPVVAAPLATPHS
jgi:lipid-A-disaccharide synthase-like uncharacterized protein